MDAEHGPDDRTVEQRAARAQQIDRELEEIFDRIGGLCRILAEEIVVFDYLNERRARILGDVDPQV